MGLSATMASHGASDLSLAIALARDAGDAIERVRVSGFSSSDKADRSPVTEADLAADRLIRQRLAEARPEDAVLTEEFDGTPPRAEQALWCIDPLDGTEAFVDGQHGDYVRGYAVQIAKLVPIEGGRYQVVLGVTYEPRFDELVYATRGGGAFRVIGGETSGPLRVSDRGREDGLVLVTSTRVDKALKVALIARGYRDGGALRSVGVKVSRMVLGLADVYPATHPISWWDLAAPQVILEEAGGRVSDFSGAPPEYHQASATRPSIRGPLVLTHGREHERVLEDLRDSLAAP